MKSQLVTPHENKWKFLAEVTVANKAAQHTQDTLDEYVRPHLKNGENR